MIQADLCPRCAGDNLTGSSPSPATCGRCHSGVLFASNLNECEFPPELVCIVNSHDALVALAEAVDIITPEITRLQKYINTGVFCDRFQEDLEVVLAALTKAEAKP